MKLRFFKIRNIRYSVKHVKKNFSLKWKKRYLVIATMLLVSFVAFPKTSLADETTWVKKQLNAALQIAFVDVIKAQEVDRPITQRYLHATKAACCFGTIGFAGLHIAFKKVGFDEYASYMTVCCGAAMSGVGTLHLINKKMNSEEIHPQFLLPEP